MPSDDRDSSESPPVPPSPVPPSPTPSRTALRSLPYAFPVALALVCFTWSLTDLVATFTDSYWVFVELLPGLVVLTVGTGFLVFGGVGALACVERAYIDRATDGTTDTS